MQKVKNETKTDEVQAEVLEPELHIEKAEPGSAIVSNIEAVKVYVESQLEQIWAYDIHDDETYKQAKRERTYVRSLKSTIDNERKRIKNLYMAPLSEFEDKVKEVTSPIDKLDAAIKQKVSAYEAEWAAVRKAELKEFFEDLAPFLALPQEGQDRELVPFDCIFDQKWLNRSTREIQAQEEIANKVSTIADGEKAVRNMNLSHEVEALAAYFETLDIGAAVLRSQEIDQQEQRALALEQARQSYTEQAALKEPEPEPAQIPEPTPQQPAESVSEPQRHYYLFRLYLTEQEYNSVMSWIMQSGLHGSVGMEASDE